MGGGGKLDFDELGIQEVVDLLNDPKTHMDAVLRDFGNRTRGEDPVIHFYEEFLKAYDKQLKVQRGVFYTPQPVVSYIERSVHELLQTEFGLVDGLADTTTWGEMLKKQRGLQLPPLTAQPGEKRTISPDEPFVRILDPATGTATFLVEVIAQVALTMKSKWGKTLGLKVPAQRDDIVAWKDPRISDRWNEYVPKDLLPRLYAYELMMEPYAIAHMKIGLKLAETGYRFGAEERARIYLTNALEPWVKQLPLIRFDALAQEEHQKERRKLLGSLNTLGGLLPGNATLKTVVDSEQQAYELILGDAGKLFDLSQEKEEMRDRYGRNTFGQSCLMARRLVEKGVPFITINYKGWDTHKQHFQIMNRKLPELDQGLAALLADLSEHGLLESTVVWCTGEFGRTPKVATESPCNGGRHHFGKVFSSLLAGGGFKGGQVLGKSNATGEEVAERPVYPADVIGSIYGQLGIPAEAPLPHPKQVEMKVAKNTLIKKALESIDNEKYAGVYDSLHKVTALLFSENPKDPAVIISSVRKENNNERPVLKAAFINGDVFVGDNQLKALTQIKTKNDLIGEIIGLLQSPIQRVLGALQNKENANKAEAAAVAEAPAAVAEAAAPAVEAVAEAPAAEAAPEAPATDTSTAEACEPEAPAK